MRQIDSDSLGYETRATATPAQCRGFRVLFRASHTVAVTSHASSDAAVAGPPGLFFLGPGFYPVLEIDYGGVRSRLVYLDSVLL